MAKRFTDTAKWDKEWFMELSPKGKFLWLYLVDACDHAGIWSENYKLASCRIGMEVSRKDLKEIGKNIVPLEDKKVFVPAFIEFQYGELDAANRAHLSAIRILEKNGIDPKTLAPTMGLISPIQGDKDKDKDKDKEPIEGGAGETNPVVPVFGTPTLLGINPTDVAMCELAWSGTLKAFGIERVVLPHEHMAIAQLVKAYGGKSTAYALTGMRFEKATETFDPKNNVAIHRARDPKMFEKFLNLASQKMTAEKKKAVSS